MAVWTKARGFRSGGPSAAERAALASLAGARPVPFWLDDPSAPEACEALAGQASCDLAVVGGGFSGLWTALLAKEREPGLDVALVEGQRIGWAASGRNGGFCCASLTHGFENGLDRFPAEIERLEALGRQNLDEIEQTIAARALACDWERPGDLTVATEPWQVEALRPSAGDAGDDTVVFLDAEAVRGEVDSPTYLAGLWDKTSALVHPAKLAWELKRACLEEGVRIFEGTVVRGLSGDGSGMVLTTDYGSLKARRVALGTNAFPHLLRRVRPYVVPVYDYALMTEPLSSRQLGEVGWANRQGLADGSNLFHYYRLTADDRVLFGGYDAVYRYGKHVRPDYDQRPRTFMRLAQHFRTCFPQLAEVGFSHRWGGAIDTCSRFCAFYGTAFAGRAAYAVGFTGLGVAPTRFGAQVMLDLLSGQPTERTGLEMVRSRPLPFPPEPLATAAIRATQWSIARADRNEGRRNAWLRALDSLGVGFES